MQRILEPEVMDSCEEAVDYDAMDFSYVNAGFAERVFAIAPKLSSLTLLDVGTGTARIPVLICQQRPHWQIVGIDLAKSMLQVGLKNIEQAGLQQQISLELVDGKQMPYANGQFEMVISNSLVHHLPDPLLFLQEIKRVLKPGGAIILRDLIRPETEEAMNALVESIGSDYDDRQTLLFRNSLNAAFTLDEVGELIEKAGLENVNVYQSSDRHWTAETAASVC